MYFAIPSYLPFPAFPFDISCVILISKSKNWVANELTKKKKRLIIILKEFLKQPVIKQSSTFICFSFLIDYCISMFSLSLSKRLEILKNIRFHWQAFIVYKNWEILKMLIEIFCQKIIVSKIILAFLDHLKPKTFLSANHGRQHRAQPLFEISGSTPASDIYFFMLLNFSYFARFVFF